MTLSDMDSSGFGSERGGAGGGGVSILLPYASSSTTPSPSQNNLNRSSHTRTHSHPLPLVGISQVWNTNNNGSQHNHDQFPSHPPPLSTPLTDALNLDFVNIPGIPGSIPVSAMQKYLLEDKSEDDHPEISDILVDLDLQGGSDMVHLSSDVVQVLDDFNTILEQMVVVSNDDSSTPDLLPPPNFVSPSNSSGTNSASSSSSKIKSSVEAFAELLLRGETEEDDEDLLIVVEGMDSREVSAVIDGDGQHDVDDEEVEEYEGEDQLCSLQEEDLDLEGGYESDRPMVRASMRKLRPIKVKLKPVLENGPVVDNSENNSGGNGGGSELCTVLVLGEGTEQIPTTLDVGTTTETLIDVESIISGTTSPSTSSGGNGDGGVILMMPEGGTGTMEVLSVGMMACTSASTSINMGGASSSPGTLSTLPQSESQSTLPSTSNTSTSANNATLSSRPSTPGAASVPTRTVPPPPTARRRVGNATTPVPAGRWPHRLSSVLALIGCTLGLNNVCRFGLLSVNYGANFVVQWVFLSFVFGIPLLSFHMSLGQYLHSGIVGMWKISPIFQGIGVGLLFSQALVGLYSTVGVSWMLIYFRDSFITRGDQYRWGKCVREFRECDPYQSQNQTSDLQDTVPDYFSGVVLQRVSPDYPNSVYVPNSLKFTVAFNLAVVWMLIFVSLSKGLKSYGKVVHGFVLAPVAALFVLTFKMVGLVDNTATLFGQTAWVEFFFNTQTWVVAAREVFFTWGLLGACVMQVTSHNRHSHPLKSDAVIVVLVTTVVLLLSAFVGNCCLSIIAGATPNTATTLLQHYSYVPSSFESDRTYKFLSVGGSGARGGLDRVEETLFAPQSSNLHHNPLLMGVRIHRMDGKGPDPTASGYQVLRMATELFPTAMAVLSTNGLSPFWTVLFYFTLVLFGLAQQLAIWHTVIKGVIAIKYKMLKSWETTITFFVCAMGFALGLPLCTETGVFVTYFLDFAVGSGWWIMILYLLELVAVFIVRGAPYCGENIVTVLLTGPGRVAKFLAPVISFIWNVIMPVALLVLSIASFKSGNIRELYDWNSNRGYIFWPSWTREIGSLLQLLPILAVPFVAIVQSCRYLTNGSSDIFERMQQLYRPSTRLRFGSANSESGRERSGASGRSEDPPPKYTPPPSYSTATGAKIARFLRNSIRRSMRRITTNPNGASSSANLPPPPAYASVILEINNHNSSEGTSSSLSSITVPPPLYSEATATAAASITGAAKEGNFRTKAPLSHTLSSDFSRKERLSSGRRISSEINSRDIARMLSLRSDDAGRGTGEHPLPGTSRHNLPPYTFSPSSLEKMEYDSLDFLNHLERDLPTEPEEPDDNRPPRFDLLSFNRSRNRNSNDSQLALISDGFLYDNINGGSRSSSRVELDIDMRLGFHHPETHSEA